ncbi:hypothetical protein OIK40_05920 [Erythrobacter sp. sf7]|uniref:DUF2975 domain-containing protein n=1 Tax=Erythrobacter fulvus TaxID=2987523 RepID=A0ABT5JQ33_9SPHN|nr:hypothetical protein [Erythrobacter fulvus]
MAVRRFRFVPLAASHDARGNLAITINADHSAGAGQDAARFFAWTVVAVAIQEIAFNTLASVIRTPEDSGRTAYFMVSSPQLVSLFLGGTLLVFASIFAKAKFVAEDSASIV